VSTRSPAASTASARRCPSFRAASRSTSTWSTTTSRCYLFETSTRTLLCGDLFTQPGAVQEPLTEGDILGPSEAFREKLDYYAHTRGTRERLEHLARLEPRVLACMHGSAWQGDGASLLRALADRVA
jgi:hypothetical protein